MKTLLSILLVLSFAFVIFGQTEKKSILWLPSEKCDICDQIIVDGDTFRIINDDNVYLAIHPTYEGDYFVTLVYLINKSTERFDFEPLKQTGVIAWKDENTWVHDHLKYTVFPSVDPETIAKKLERRTFWANVLRSFSAGVNPSTTTATVSTNQPGQLPTTSTVTVPNDQAKREAERQNAVINSQVANQKAEMLGRALRANTLFPNEKVYGNIYYPRKKGFEVIGFNFVLNNKIYSFVYIKP